MTELLKAKRYTPLEEGTTRGLWAAGETEWVIEFAREGHGERLWSIGWIGGEKQNQHWFRSQNASEAWLIEMGLFGSLFPTRALALEAITHALAAHPQMKRLRNGAPVG